MKKKLHQVYVKRTTYQNWRKQTFDIGIKSWFLVQKAYPIGTYNKKYMPCQIEKKITHSMYVRKLKKTMGISKTFNIVYVFSFHSLDEPIFLDISNSRSGFYQVEDNDTVTQQGKQIF